MGAITRNAAKFEPGVISRERPADGIGCVVIARATSGAAPRN
jgi:hypothetical protein